MSKPAKKPSPDRHKTPRRQIVLPLEWAEFAAAMAKRSRQTIGIYLIGLLLDAANAAGVEAPTPPWEKEKS